MCVALWPLCPLHAKDLLSNESLDAKFWGELYGSRPLSRAIAHLKPLTWVISVYLTRPKSSRAFYLWKNSSMCSDAALEKMQWTLPLARIL